MKHSLGLYCIFRYLKKNLKPHLKVFRTYLTWEPTPYQINVYNRFTDYCVVRICQTSNPLEKYKIYIFNSDGGVVRLATERVKSVIKYLSKYTKGNKDNGRKEKEGI